MINFNIIIKIRTLNIDRILFSNLQILLRHFLLTQLALENPWLCICCFYPPLIWSSSSVCICFSWYWPFWWVHAMYFVDHPLVWVWCFFLIRYRICFFGRKIMKWCVLLSVSFQETHDVDFILLLVMLTFIFWLRVVSAGFFKLRSINVWGWIILCWESMGGRGAVLYIIGCLALTLTSTR